MKYYLISNPSSRSGASQSATTLLMKRLEAKKIPYQVDYTTGPGSAAEITARITDPSDDEEKVLVVFGGDGTINETLSGIQRYDNLRFAFVPVGSGNDFARGLGLTAGTLEQLQERIVKRILENQIIRTIDLGNVHYDHLSDSYSRRHISQIARDRVFAVSCGIGFDAAVCEEALQSGTKDFLNRIHLGSLSYGAIAVKQLAKAPNTRCIVTIDDEEVIRIDRLLFAAVMNTSYEGGGYRFAPDAHPDDGLLNFVAIGDMPRLKALSKFPAAHRGAFYQIKGVHHAMAKKIRIEVADPLWVHTDGEVSVQSQEITITCVPDRLRMIV